MELRPTSDGSSDYTGFMVPTKEVSVVLVYYSFTFASRLFQRVRKLYQQY